QMDRDRAAGTDLPGVTGKPEPGDIRRGVDLVLDGEASGAEIEPQHHVDRRCEHSAVHSILLGGGGQYAGAERLGQQHGIAGPGTRFRPDAARVDQAGDREPVLRLIVGDRVTTRDYAAGFDDLV